METRTNEPIQVSELLPLPERPSVNYKSIKDEDIEVTDEELATLIKNFKSEKAARLRTIAYQEHISKPLIYPEVTAQQLGIIIKKHSLSINPDFVLDEQALGIFKLLCQYFTQDPEFEEQGFSLKKGIFLFGNIGAGKTTMMRLFQRNVTNDYYVVSCRQVADEYTKFGADALEKYSSINDVYPHEHYGQKFQGVCFDDLGTEKNKKYFGNEVNVMEDIFQNRYDRGLIGKTHITSNLSADEVEEFYGSRVRSRLREMCNMISFDENAFDRRK